MGQGDAAVLESPSGKVLLIDTGGISHDGDDDEGRRVVAPYLRQRGINRIDVILLSHPHADHIGGAKSLLERFGVGLLMDNGQDLDSAVVTPILEAVKRKGTLYQQAQRGQELNLGDGVILHILAPTEKAVSDRINDASMVVRVEYGRTAFLFTGDAEASEEAEIVRSGQTLGSDVLKVGHHGSRTSSTASFLTAVHPKIAVISVGARNLYGHPNSEVLDRLSGLGTHIFRTDKKGAVTCFSNGITLRTETMQP